MKKALVLKGAKNTPTEALGKYAEFIERTLDISVIPIPYGLELQIIEKGDLDIYISELQEIQKVYGINEENENEKNNE